MRFPSIFKRKPKECHDCFRKENIMKMAARAMDTLLVGKDLDELEPHEMMSLLTISRALRFNIPLIGVKRRGSPYRDRTGNEVGSMYEVLRNNFVHFMGMLAADIQAMFIVDSPIRDEIAARYKRHTDVYLKEMENEKNMVEMEKKVRVAKEVEKIMHSDTESEESEENEENE